MGNGSAAGASRPATDPGAGKRPHTDGVATLRAVVVDDEQLAREEVCFLLGEIEGVDVVGQASNGVEALQVIEAEGPDLVTLDVQMPGLTGFEVARRLFDAGIEAQLVFVTAFDQHAIQAFEVNAVDYLLKPVESGRLRTTVERVRRRLAAERPAAAASAGELDRLLQLLSQRQEHREQLAVKIADRFLLIQADEVVHASVENDVITVVTNSLSGTSNYRTLDELQARLDPAVFWRVHRSHLVNINKIKEIVPWFSRNYILKMKNGKGSEIPVSRSQTKRLREYLKL
jgi:two-component system LytT family response regulator/two-component system response regulator LytT